VEGELELPSFRQHAVGPELHDSGRRLDDVGCDGPDGDVRGETEERLERLHELVRAVDPLVEGGRRPMVGDGEVVGQ
jgi:hypothetical protein